MPKSGPKQPPCDSSGFDLFLQSLPAPTRLRLEKIRSKGFFELGEILSRYPADEKLLKSLEQRTERLEKILSAYRAAFDRLVQWGCHRNGLSSRLLRNPKSPQKFDDAEGRKAAKNELGSLAATLRKAAKLVRGTGNRYADLNDVFRFRALTVELRGPARKRMGAQQWLNYAATRVEEHVQSLGLRLLFSPRDNDRLDFLLWVEKETRKPRYKEAADLLSAKERTTVSESYLKKLMTAYRKNSLAWQTNPLHLRSKK